MIVDYSNAGVKIKFSVCVYSIKMLTVLYVFVVGRIGSVEYVHWYWQWW